MDWLSQEMLVRYLCTWTILAGSSAPCPAEAQVRAVYVPHETTYAVVAKLPEHADVKATFMASDPNIQATMKLECTREYADGTQRWVSYGRTNTSRRHIVYRANWQTPGSDCRALFRPTLLRGQEPSGTFVSINLEYTPIHWRNEAGFVDLPDF